MKSRGIIAGVVLGVAWAAAPASPQTLGGIDFHGFVSQGYLNSTDNNWLTAPTSEGSFAFTEAALNFTVEPVSKLRIGGQFISRDLGAVGNNRVVLDWAVGDYRFTDNLGLRAGKVKMPLGLYNIVVDNPVARSEVFQPTGIYPLFTRDITNTVQGAQVYGTFGLGGAGELDYEVWGGTIDVDESYIMERFSVEGAYNGLPMLGLEQGDVVVSDISATVDYTVGASVEWRPIRGLRLKASNLTTDAEISSAAVYSGFLTQGGSPVPIPVSITTRSHAFYKQRYAMFFSFEYRSGGLRVAGEHYRSKSEVTTSVTGLPFPVPEMTSTNEPISCYGQVAYRFNRTWELSGYYSFLYSEKDDKDGERFVERGQPAHKAWSKQWNFAVRADINRHWLFKAEVDFFDGTAGVDFIDNPDGLEQKWTLFALQTVVHF